MSANGEDLDIQVDTKAAADVDEGFVTKVIHRVGDVASDLLSDLVFSWWT